MSRPRERSTTSSLVAVAAMLAGCSKGAAPSTAPVVDAGVAPSADGGADTNIHWECGDALAVHIDPKDSPYPVADAVGSGWCRLPFAPAASRQRIAFRENMPVRMPAWGPCDGGAPGCRRISSKAWTTYPTPFYARVRADAAGKPWFSFSQNFEQPPYVDVPWSFYFFEGVLDEDPTFVVYSVSGGSDAPPDGYTYNASSFGMLLSVEPKGFEACERGLVFVDPLRKDAFRVLADPTRSCGADVDQLTRLVAERGTVGPKYATMLGAPSGAPLTSVVDTTTGTIERMLVAGRPFALGGDAYAAPGGVIINLDAPPSYPLAFVDEATGEGTILVTPPGGRMLIPMGLDWSTTPPTLVWVEGDDQGTALTNVDVYASPFSRTPEGITRRKVTHIPDRYWTQGAVNAGYYVTGGSDDWNKNWIIRLSDGVRWPFVIGPERDVGAFWVTKDEIFYKTGDYAAWQASGLSENALPDFVDGLERASITALLATTPLPRIP